MKKISIVVHQNYLEDVIQNLHETGLVEIIDILKDESEDQQDIEKASMHPESGVCSTYVLRLTRLIDILKKTQIKPGGIKALLNPQIPEIRIIDEKSCGELYSLSEGILGEIENKILGFEKNLNELKEKKEKINFDSQQVSYLKDFELDLSDIGESEYLIIKTGKTTDLSSIEQQIKELENVVLYSKQFGSGKEIEWAVVIVSQKANKENIEKICREKLNEFDINHLTGSPKDVLNLLKKEGKDINEEKKKILKQLRNYADQQLNDLFVLREELQLELVRKEISKNFVKTDSTYIIQGWVLEKNEKEISDLMKTVANGQTVIDLEKPSLNPDNPPTYVKTPKWAEGFKGLLSMFSLPRYGEINPTIIMGIFFILFFGIMLGDAGYGLIILILSLFGYFKFGKYSNMIRNWSFMGLWMGVVTTVVGLLTNSFFGDFIPRFIYGNSEASLYSLTIGGIHLPANSIKDPITILVVALLFGLLHLNVGVVLGIIQTAKQKKYKEMLTAKSCWIPLQLGGGLLIGVSILDFQIPEILMYIAVILVIIGLIQLFLSAGPIGFFEITGYVGDWLSYARLLALGLATAGMALAFNVVAQLLGEMIPFIGILITIILLVVAHLVNLGLQALGAGIHSLRLQYVEFFNRFYEGGGHEFTPFKIKRKYTKTEEEES